MALWWTVTFGLLLFDLRGGIDLFEFNATLVYLSVFSPLVLFVRIREGIGSTKSVELAKYLLMTVRYTVIGMWLPSAGTIAFTLYLKAIAQ